MDCKFLGRHFIAEFHMCDANIINDMQAVEKIMTDAVVLSGACIIKPFFHTFSPQGVSGIIVISESHFAVHTWPEHSYAAVDIFSCSDFRYREALTHIRDGFQSGEYYLSRINRGISGESATNDCGITIEHFKL